MKITILLIPLLLLSVFTISQTFSPISQANGGATFDIVGQVAGNVGTLTLAPAGNIAYVTIGDRLAAIDTSVPTTPTILSEATLPFDVIFGDA
jgi:hypothetical protein